MPTFSRQYAEGKLDEIRQTLAATLRGVILLSLPAAAGLILLRTPFVAMLFQYRSFTAGTTALVAWALAWYASGLVFHSLLEILVRAYYAMHDTRTPVLVGAAAMTLSIGLSLVLPSLFERIGWMPHGGLALAVIVNTVGFSALGTLFAAMTARTRRSELLLPLLLFPAATPLVIFGVKATRLCLAERPVGAYGNYLALSACFAAVFIAAGILLFDYVIEE